jgi:hypothetical protein
MPYDSVDLVYPSLENDAFFLATKYRVRCTAAAWPIGACLHFVILYAFSFLQTDQVQSMTGCLDYDSPCTQATASEDCANSNNDQDRGAGTA